MKPHIEDHEICAPAPDVVGKQKVLCCGSLLIN